MAKQEEPKRNRGTKKMAAKMDASYTPKVQTEGNTLEEYAPGEAGEPQGPTSPPPPPTPLEPPQAPAPELAPPMSPLQSPPLPISPTIDDGRSIDLFLGFACYKDTNPVTAWCLIATAKEMGNRMKWDLEYGDAMIYHARNRLAQKFLQTDATWLLMLDSDIVPPIGRPEFYKQACRLPAAFPHEAAGRHFIHRLTGHRKTLVGGSYFSRNAENVMINSLFGDFNIVKQAKECRDIVLPCEWVGTGCILIHRDVFKAIEGKFPDLAPRQSGMPFNYFMPLPNGDGEDIAFCRRAAAAGHQPHVDLGLPCQHIGYSCYGPQTTRVL